MSQTLIDDEVESAIAKLSAEILKKIDQDIIHMIKNLELKTRPFSLVKCNLHSPDILQSIVEYTLRKGAVHGKVYAIDGGEIIGPYSLLYLMEFPDVPFYAMVFENYENP